MQLNRPIFTIFFTFDQRSFYVVKEHFFMAEREFLGWICKKSFSSAYNPIGYWIMETNVCRVPYKHLEDCWIQNPINVPFLETRSVFTFQSLRFSKLGRTWCKVTMLSMYGSGSWIQGERQRDNEVLRVVKEWRIRLGCHTWMKRGGDKNNAWIWQSLEAVLFK